MSMDMDELPMKYIILQEKLLVYEHDHSFTEDSY